MHLKHYKEAHMFSKLWMTMYVIIPMIRVFTLAVKIHFFRQLVWNMIAFYDTMARKQLWNLVRLSILFKYWAQIWIDWANIGQTREKKWWYEKLNMSFTLAWTKMSSDNIFFWNHFSRWPRFWMFTRWIKINHLLHLHERALRLVCVLVNFCVQIDNSIHHKFVSHWTLQSKIWS